MTIGARASSLSLPGRHPEGVPPVLMPYQSESIACTDEVVVIEKGRRVGITWGYAGDSVTVAAAAAAAGGDDTLYIGYNREMAEEFMADCGWWGRHLGAFASAVQVEEYVFDDETPDGKRSIQAFRIRFKSGFKIAALTSRPRSLRGRQGRVIVDEAAFVDDLEELLKAAMALLMWGGRVIVISTHNGVDNAFNELVVKIREGRLPYRLFRITFSDAVEQGLYRRICLTRGIPWTPEGETEWVERIYALYGDNAAEELDVIPSQGGGLWLPLSLLESAAARGADVPVLRWSLPDAFAEMGEAMREADCRDWLERNVGPLLAALDDQPSYFGMDFGRSGDLSVIWPIQLLADMTRRPPFVLELRNVPFEQQRQVLFYICDRLPRFSGGAMDAGGNGSYLAEVAWQRYGSGRIERVKFSLEWYREQMPPYKAAMQDEQVVLPKDRDVIDDHRAIVMDKGVARVPEARATGRDKGQRHGDAAIASALAYYATRMLIVTYGYEPAPRRRPLDERGATAGRLLMTPPADQDLVDAGARDRGAW